jgi:hypothetical protein
MLYQSRSQSTKGGNLTFAPWKQLSTDLPLSPWKQRAPQYQHISISLMPNACTLEMPQATFPWSVDSSAFIPSLYVFTWSLAFACNHPTKPGQTWTVLPIKTFAFFDSLYTPLCSQMCTCFCSLTESSLSGADTYLADDYVPRHSHIQGQKFNMHLPLICMVWKLPVLFIKVFQCCCVIQSPSYETVIISFLKTSKLNM